MPKALHRPLLDQLTNDPEKDFKILKQIWLLWKAETKQGKCCFSCTLKYAIKWLTED